MPTFRQILPHIPAVLLAPMEDVTDLPFRLICKRMGADIMYTEFVNAEGLVRGSDKTKQKMLFSEEERPFGIQLYGGAVDSMGRAAEFALQLKPDIIDINCGCWVKDVAMRGAGAGLLRDIPKMVQIASAVVEVSNVPVTVKTRLGWDSESIRIAEVAKRLEDVGVQGLTVHCRTRAQGHSGEPDFSWIPEVKRNVSMPVIVNGNITDVESAHKALDISHADGIMIGRGAISHPWVFREIRRYFDTGERLPPPTLSERISTLLEHLKLSVEYKGERRGVIEFRKHYAGYLRGLRNSAPFRNSLMGFTEYRPIEEAVLMFAESYDNERVAVPA